MPSRMSRINTNRMRKPIIGIEPMLSIRSLEPTRSIPGSWLRADDVSLEGSPSMWFSGSEYRRLFNLEVKTSVGMNSSSAMFLSSARII